jgi:putative DNA primase/helicase
MIDPTVLGAIYAHAKYSNGAKGIQNCVALARSQIAINVDELDTDPWLFNVNNGTIDLRTAELREHRREDYITKLAPVTFDTNAPCPQWEEFLRRIFNGNEELIGYVQRLVGYCLTGSTEEHVLPILLGTGANGKSTFLETIMGMMGRDYAMKAPPGLLMAKRGESHPTERADLFGKRLVACVETGENRRLAEALVKELTGGDRIRARRMREDFWEFAPTHHLRIASNYKPVIRGTDYGIWRRIKLIPFEVVIPEAEQDKKLPTKLSYELSGILSWCVQGCLDWQQHGLRHPACVDRATSGYRNEMDAVSQFIDEHCERGDFLVSAGELYLAFQASGPNRQISQRAFGDRLRLMGFSNHDPATGRELRDCKGRRAWRGLRLRRDPNGEGGGEK